MKTKKFNTSQLTILGLMSGILFLMAYTPLGYLNVGPLAVTFNVIPVPLSLDRQAALLQEPYLD